MLVDAAPGDLGTLAATMRHWVHHERAVQARERLNESSGSTAVMHSVVGVHTPGGPRAEVSEQVSRVWVATPNRWRIEGDDEHDSLDISDGAQRWQGLAGFVTERGRDPDLADAGPLGRLLVPGPLLGLFTFPEVAEDERAGRRCYRAVGVMRQGGGASRLLPLAMLTYGAATEHQFWIDTTHGFVVCHEGLLDGQPAVVTELDDVVVDEPVEPAQFQVPDCTTIQTEAEEHLRHLERLGVDTSDLDTSGLATLREAIMAAARGPGPRSQSRLDERVRQNVPWAPPPEDEAAAQAAVTAAFEAFGATSADGRDLVNVQAGHGLGPYLAEAQRRVPRVTPDNMTTSVKTVRFLAPHEAVVWFSITAGDPRAPLVSERQGRAVRVHGRWLVEHATLVDLLALSGTRVPPPDERTR